MGGRGALDNVQTMHRASVTLGPFRVTTRCSADAGQAHSEPLNETKLRESETTIKIKFALFRGGGLGRGAGRKLSKTLFFMGNVMTIKF